MTTPPLLAVLDDLHREEWGGLVGGLVGRTGDWALAEDCVQDAFASALVAWRSGGVPDRPAAWLFTVARNKARDRLRHAVVEREKLRDLVDLEAQVDELPEIDETALRDEELRLLFTCCHPALALPNRVALTLRAVAGLTTGEIASAFFVQEPTMAQRLVRARQKITNAGIPYRVPTEDLLPERLHGVLAVLYLLFNQGYSDASRTDLADAAIRMTRNVVRFAPTDDARSLLSLMLLQSSRRAARLSADGRQLTLENQDRSLWDRSAINEALTLLAPLTAVSDRGFYRIQAEIAACHASAATPNATDWRRIARLYDVLVTMTSSPVVALSRAIAVGMATGPETALDILDNLDADPRLSTSHLMPAARGDMLARAGRHTEAATAFTIAAERATSDLDRQQLLREATATLQHCNKLPPGDDPRQERTPPTGGRSMMAQAHAERRFTLTRTLPAPRSVVFAAWTEPEHLAWFYNPDMPIPTTPIHVDLEVGGVWRQQMVVNDDLQYPTGGVYLEVVPDERLVFRWGAIGGWPELSGNHEQQAPIVTVTLRDAAEGTSLELTVTFPDELEDEAVRSLIDGGTRDGWSATIDRVAESTAIVGWRSLDHR